jgi:hypothetical protein
MFRRHDLPGGYHAGGYDDWPGPSLAEVQARWLRWLWPAVTVAGFLALVAYVLSYDDPRPGLSDRGWLILTLAALLLVALSIHRSRGTWRLVGALTEYAVVALLAVLLTLTALPGAHPPTGKQAPGKPPAVKRSTGKQAGPAAKGAGGGCPAVVKVPAWLACLWRQANPPPPATPDKARALPRSPAASRRTP